MKHRKIRMITALALCLCAILAVAGPALAAEQEQPAPEPIQPQRETDTMRSFYGETDLPRQELDPVVEQALLALGGCYLYEEEVMRASGDMGLIKGSFESVEQLAAGAYASFSFSTWCDAASQAGLLERVQDPDGQYSVAVYPQAAYEALVLQHFGVDISGRRTDSPNYSAQYQGYYPGGYCGTTTYPTIWVVHTLAEENLLRVHLRLGYGTTTQDKELVLRVTEDSWQYVSYRNVEYITVSCY